MGGTTALSLGPATELVGRELEADVLRERLRDPSVRLVTVTGRAGVGKSRLAVEVVREIGGEFARVAALDPAGVRAGLPELPGLPEQPPELPVPAGLPGRMLVVLDGCDHEARPAAAAAVEALTGDPRVVVLATAVEPLGVYGEQLLPLAPLPVPGPRRGPAGGADPHEVREAASVALFVRRARDADPSFALTEENAGAVAEICTLLGGLPLAVELAAMRLRLFPPHLLSARLRGRTTILSGGPANAPERHRSLAALAEWSCRGLDDGARALLGRLSVYEPGFGLPAAGLSAEAAVETLLDRGLLAVVGEEQGELRLAVPEPVRSHCRAELADSGREGAALDAHAERYRQLVTTALPGLRGTEQGRLLRESAAEAANVSGALRRLRERGDSETVAALVLGCGLPWLAQGRLREGLEWCDDTVEAGGAALPEGVRARLADLSGVFALALGDPQEAVRRHRHALALGKSVGDRRQNALASARLGAALLRAGDPAGARAVLVTALNALESMGVTGGAADAAGSLAAVLRAEGDRRKAQELLDRCVETFRRTRDGRGLAGALRTAAALALEGDEPDRADRALRESLRLYGSFDERTELPGALEEFSLLLLRTAPAQRPRTVRLLAAADTLRGETGAEVADEWRSAAERARAELSARLGWTDFAVAWAEGVRMTVPAAVAEALSSPAPSRRAAAGTAPEAQSLTPRQVQVALLVSEGMTNRQIAAKLDISEWTVVNHVRHVMRRLGCSSRVQVAGAVGRWA
ncbi:LuxR C-terminal-related transcriptional regulator [Streptomyces sp. MB09-01]|uniref:ATP-binding protein n=1 Tax=Streptomyces sp. MB09-01 TaxID=3028666 RepID=UPI0029A93AFE|nr:LuxR C-terminal-related transcriptional regulator [Streptomyces sp. MB09-01]MDX3534783.1 LuxR C-terminal-related transcriptional regulator [Streptomyces sp. MB09-01]